MLVMKMSLLRIVNYAQKQESGLSQKRDNDSNSG